MYNVFSYEGLIVSIQVAAAGINYDHEEDYVLDRPGGYRQAYVLIFFLSPCLVGEISGVVASQEGQAIIYDPSFAQYNRGDGVAVRNHWLHLSGERCGEFIHKCCLPVNTVFTPGEWDFIAPAINEMRLEIFQHRRYMNDILSRLAENFLMRLGRGCSEKEALGVSNSDIAHLDSFRNLRGQILSNFSQDWTLEQMAQSVSLSRSRFCCLYKKFFGISPINDLINCRLDQSRNMLVATSLTVEGVAARCGFSSVIHFHRLFKKRFGAAPRELCHSEIPYLDPFSDRPSPHHNI